MLRKMPATERDTVTSDLKQLGSHIKNLKKKLLSSQLECPNTIKNEDIKAFEDKLWVLEEHFASLYNILIKDSWDSEITSLKKDINKQAIPIQTLYIKLIKNSLPTIEIDYLLTLFFDHLQTLFKMFSLYLEPFYVSENMFKNFLYDFEKNLLNYQTVIETYQKRLVHDSLCASFHYYTLSTYFQFLDNYKNELGSNIDYFQASISAIRLALGSLEHQIVHKENSLEILDTASSMRKRFNRDLAEKLICSAQFFAEQLVSPDLDTNIYFIFLNNAIRSIDESIYILEEYPINLVNEKIIQAYKIKNAISDKIAISFQQVVGEQKTRITALEDENTKLRSANTVAPQACLFSHILQPTPIRTLSLNIEPDKNSERISTPIPIYTTATRNTL